MRLYIKHKKKQDRECNFLCGILRSFIKGTTCPDVPDGINWNRLERIAAHNGLIPLLQHSLNSSQIPQDRLLEWKHVSINIFLQYQRSLKAAVKLSDILEAEGIPSVVLRGMALVHRSYKDPVLRPMTDVDMLISSDARHQIVNLLAKHGLLPIKIFRSQFVYLISDTIIEIHWSFLTPKRYRKAADFNRWIASREKIKTDEGYLYILSLENELIELICHAFIHHDLNGFLKLVDIAILCWNEELDWEYIRSWCEKASLMRMFCFTLKFTNYIFDLKMQAKLTLFDSHLPAKKHKVFTAYASRLFEEDLPIHFLRRKLHMLFVAEHPYVKLKQFLRFLNLDEISDLFRILCKKKQTCKDRYTFRKIRYMGSQVFPDRAWPEGKPAFEKDT